MLDMFCCLCVSSVLLILVNSCLILSDIISVEGWCWDPGSSLALPVFSPLSRTVMELPSRPGGFLAAVQRVHRLGSVGGTVDPVLSEVVKYILQCDAQVRAQEEGMAQFSPLVIVCPQQPTCPPPCTCR